jgi:hypothetical protein
VGVLAIARIAEVQSPRCSRSYAGGTFAPREAVYWLSYRPEIAKLTIANPAAKAASNSSTASIKAHNPMQPSVITISSSSTPNVSLRGNISPSGQAHQSHRNRMTRSEELRLPVNGKRCHSQRRKTR